jgi:prevent-host-death family protein
MKLSESVKSISYLKANAAKLIEKINKEQKTFVITQNGEAKVIVQDVKVYEKTQETMAMLKLLVLTRDKNKAAKGIRETFAGLRRELKSGMILLFGADG